MTSSYHAPRTFTQHDVLTALREHGGELAEHELLTLLDAKHEIEQEHVRDILHVLCMRDVLHRTLAGEHESGRTTWTLASR